MISFRVPRRRRHLALATTVALMAAGTGATTAQAAVEQSLWQTLYSGSHMVASTSGTLSFTPASSWSPTGFKTSFCLRDVYTDGSAVKMSMVWFLANGTRVTGPTWSTGGTNCLTFAHYGSTAITTVRVTLRRSLYSGYFECDYTSYGAKTCRTG
jgi:hypothetical protein